MKSVKFLGASKLEIVDIPMPECPGDDYAIVKVMASSICGTERHTFEYDPVNHPDPMLEGRKESDTRLNGGHEAAGIVYKAGPRSGVKEGDRVHILMTYHHCGRCRFCETGRWILCQSDPNPPLMSGLHAQYVAVRGDYCLPLGDDIPFEIGSLFGDVMGTSYHAIKRLRVTGLDTVLIVGQGPIGLASTMICDFLGADVVATDVNDYRLGMARTCGAKDVINITKEDTLARSREIFGADGPTVAIDCSGTEAGRLACMRAVRRGGRVGLVGLGHEGMNISPMDFLQNYMLKDLEMISSWYSDPVDALELQDLVRRGLRPERMITHEFPIDQAADAYRTMFDGTGAKVVIRAW